MMMISADDYTRPPRWARLFKLSDHWNNWPKIKTSLHLATLSRLRVF